MDNSPHGRDHAVLRGLLKELRIRAGMRQADLAAELGVQQTLISRYETGDRRLDLVEVRQIYHALKTDLPTLARLYERRLDPPVGL